MLVSYNQSLVEVTSFKVRGVKILLNVRSKVSKFLFRPDFNSKNLDQAGPGQTRPEFKACQNVM